MIKSKSESESEALRTLAAALDRRNLIFAYLKRHDLLSADRGVFNKSHFKVSTQFEASAPGHAEFQFELDAMIRDMGPTILLHIKQRQDQQVQLARQELDRITDALSTVV